MTMIVSESDSLFTELITVNSNESSPTVLGAVKVVTELVGALSVTVVPLSWDQSYDK